MNKIIRSKILSGMILSAVALFLLVGIVLGYKLFCSYPQPAYDVASYEELFGKIGQSYILPDASLVADRGYGVYYQVRLKDRFHDDPSGYSILYYLDESGQDSVYINCELLSENPGYEAGDRTPILYHGIEIYQGEVNLVWCNMDDSQYSVCMIQSEKSETVDSMQILKQIIDQWLMNK